MDNFRPPGLGRPSQPLFCKRWWLYQSTRRSLPLACKLGVYGYRQGRGSMARSPKPIVVKVSKVK